MMLYALWFHPTLFHIQRTYLYQLVISERVLEERWSQCALMWGLLYSSCCLPALQRTMLRSLMINFKAEAWWLHSHICRSHYEKSSLFVNGCKEMESAPAQTQGTPALNAPVFLFWQWLIWASCKWQKESKMVCGLWHLRLALIHLLVGRVSAYWLK